MRGEVLTFDEASGQGAIAGDDGARYRFDASAIRGATFIERGQRVDFVATDDRQAQEIIALRPAAAVAGASGGGSGVFDLGRVIQRTFSAIKTNAAVFFGAAVLLVGVPGAIQAYGQTQMVLVQNASSLAFVSLGFILYLLGLFILQGMIVKAAVNGFAGRSTSFGDAFGVGLRQFLPLVGLAIVAGIATAFGYLLLIVPGVLLSIIWSVAAPAVVVEKRGIFESLQRSRDLTRGYRGQVFGLLVIYVVFSWIIAIAITGIGVATGGTVADGSAIMIVNLITGPLVNVLSGVVASAGVASLYYELRTAKEGASGDDLASVFD